MTENVIAQQILQSKAKKTAKQIPRRPRTGPPLRGGVMTLRAKTAHGAPNRFPPLPSG